MSNYSDISNLISSLQQRDEKAFAYLYDNYSASLYGIILKIVTSEEDANDVLQESFVNIWNNIQSYDEKRGGSLFTWMLNITRNKAIDRYRQKNRVAQNQSAYQNVHIQNEALNSESVKVESIGVKSLVESIKPEWKELIDLHYFRGYTHQEITELKQMPLGTVKTKIRSAMSELKKLFGTS